MLTILTGGLPSAYTAEIPVCFQSVSDILHGLLDEAAEKKEISASLFAFALSREEVAQAVSASSDGSRVCVGDPESPILTIQGEGECRRFPGYPASNVGDWYDILEKYRRSVLLSYARRGVIFASFDGVIICPDAVIGEGTVILPGTEIESGVTIGKNCVIGPRCHLIASTVKDGSRLRDTRVDRAKIDENVTIGPYCNIRPDSHIRAGCKIGDFVEVKNSTLGEGTHASHLTYIGDSDVGKRVNFGCGVVTANYDGFMKYRTTIGDDAFIGCNTNLVAPVRVGNGAVTACGSTVTDEVPEDALGIARARQQNKEGWAKKFRALKSAEKARKAEEAAKGR